MYRRQGARPSPRKEMQKAKWLSEEALQIAVKRREAKSKEEKEGYIHFFALITEEGVLISPCYSLELCIQMLVGDFCRL